MEPLSNEQIIMLELETFIASFRDFKPNDRSPIDRIYAVMLTDLEKVRAYWKVAAILDKPTE